jgi:hypothetical protein
MNPRHEKLVLVLFSLAALAIAWVSGCAGMAEPLPTLAVAPDSLTVTTKVGNASSLPVTITNTGTVPVKVTEAVLSGTGFSMQGLAMPLNLIGGGSATFNVKFSASKVESVTGSVVFVTDARHRPAMLPLHGTGSSLTPEVSSILVSPAVATLSPSAKAQFTAAIQGATTNDSVTWTSTIGTINGSGVFTAPSNGGVGTIVATSVADPTKSATAIVAIKPTATSTPTPTPSAPGAAVSSVTVSPAVASSITGGTLPFSAKVQGTSTDTAVTWKALLGTISSGGTYTAPAKAGTDTVTATSVADPSKSGSASVTVTAAPAPTPTPTPTVTSITISPTSGSVTTGGKLQFSALLQGTVTNKSVTWTAALGTITSSGAYTAPAKAGSDTVTATSVAETSKSASAGITVTAPTQTPTPPSPPAPSSPTSSASCNGSNCPAFPGAQGGGAASAGGRGGVVIEVTNNNDSGQGSLRACVMASGPRTCVFRVAGLFPITSGDLRFSSPYLTVAGQTAPGEVILGGPNTNGALFGVSTHDVILRYVTMSPDNFNVTSGPDTGTTSIWIVNCPGNGTLNTGGCYNIIVDHVTTRWSGNKSWITTSNYTPLIDGNGNGDGPNHEITTQWTLDYEPHEGHPVGYGTATDETCVGTLSGPCLSPSEKNIDFHHNMFVNVGHRIPENSNFSTRWVNNIIYNWNYYANEWLGAEQIDDINNKFITGNLNSGAQAHPIHFTTNSAEMRGNPSVYVNGNIFGPPGTNTVNSDQYGELVSEITGENGDETGAIPGGWKRSNPMNASNSFPIVPDPATSLDNIMLSTIGNSQHLDCNGNWVSHRDLADQRIVSQYQHGGNGGFWPNAVTFSGQALSTADAPGSDWQDHPVTGFTACTESQHDGIPDQWKELKGLSKSDPDLYKKTAPNGYTWLENYINGQ